MIVVVGLSHRTAPINVRELIALPRDVVPTVLSEIVARSDVGEAMLVSTCNRVEVVAAGKHGFDDADLERVAAQVKQALVQRAPGLQGNLYEHLGGEGVRHLFRVASSLDSLVLGEPQILGQVKDAFETARQVGTVGSALNRAVPRAIRTAKRVRSQTAIGMGQVSVPSVSVDLAKQIFGDLEGRTVMLIGSGEMAETVARLLGGCGARIVIVGRNKLRVAELTRSVGGEGRQWGDLKATLVEADVVLTSTSAPTYVVDYDLVKSVRKQRRGRSLFFIDLAVPRDVDPRVESLANTFLYNIDDFSKVVAGTLSSRQHEAERAEQIVLEETQGYQRWREVAQMTPTIVALRERFRRILVAELERSLKGRLKHLGPEEHQALDKMCEAALNKMLHHPTARLRETAAEYGVESHPVEQLVAAIDELFALEGEHPELHAAPDAAASGEPAERAEPEPEVELSGTHVATGTRGR